MRKISCHFNFFTLFLTLKVKKNGSFAHVAQLVEHFLGKGEVTGSIPVAGSSLHPFGAWVATLVF